MNWISFRPIVALFNLGLNTIINEANMLKTYLAVKCITKNRAYLFDLACMPTQTI